MGMSNTDCSREDWMCNDTCYEQVVAAWWLWGSIPRSKASLSLKESLFRKCSDVQHLFAYVSKCAWEHSTGSSAIHFLVTI